MGSQFNQPDKPTKYYVTQYFHYNFLCIRILEVDIRNTVEMLSRTFGSDEAPVKVSFVNHRFEQWLTYQDKLNVLSEILTVISGLMACCAIYGLSLSLVRDKIKQIAIHKMYGATTLNITRLLVREFVMLVLAAIAIFGPITFIFLREWLRSFAYTTPFQWSDPVLPIGYCIVVITLLCGLQANNLSRADLTTSLKD